MARRRSYRRSTSQRAASLLALALPGPVARLAETRIGPFLILIGVPILIITGLLRVNFQDGLPHFSLNREKASQLQGQIGTMRQDGTFQEWEKNAMDLYYAAQARGQSTYGVPSTQQYSQFPSTEPARQSYDPNNWQTPVRTQPNSTGYGYPTSPPSTYGQYGSQGYQTARPGQPSYQQPAAQQPTYAQQQADQQYQQWMLQQRQQPAAATGYQMNNLQPSYSQPQYQQPYSQQRTQSSPYQPQPQYNFGTQDRSAAGSDISRGRY